MTTTETPEAAEARELTERALRLPAPLREKLLLDVARSVNPPPGPSDADWEYWKAEIARRIEAVENGSAKTVTPEELHANIKKALEEGRKP